MLILGKVGDFISNERAADRSLYKAVSDPIFGKVTPESAGKNVCQSCMQPYVAAYNSFAILGPSRESLLPDHTHQATLPENSANIILPRQKGLIIND
jgi:hypothetical protein